MWRYRMLGSLEVEVSGEAVALPAPKHRTLLLALLLENGTLCSSDQLVEALWERPPASAGKVLQAYVSHLRSVLGAEVIETLPSGYRLHVEPAHVDAHRFEDLLERARARLEAGNPLLAGSLATRALALWRGPALADVAYESFAQREATRLEELRMQCLEIRVDADLASGHPKRAIAELVALCRSHPEREPFHERLALALYRTDRQADALATIDAARRHLAEELGLDPGRGLRDLEHAILTQDPALDQAPIEAPEPAVSVPAPQVELIGRRRELDHLLAMVVHDEAPFVTITGPGGSGKTSVALELARRSRAYFAHGTVLVELASITDPDLVVQTIARALGLSETALQPAAEVVAEWLRSRQVLLVVDNFEHLTDAAAALAELVRGAPLVSVLVTSRRVLHLRSEQVYPLGPMTLDAAGRLFAERAWARSPELRIDAADETVRDICTRLDCLPLALEIAAARVGAIDPGTLRDRLRADLGALGPGPRDAPARQQTLADTIRWTTEQLEPSEQRTLARLASFVGGGDLSAVAKVCDAELTTITALVEWNLVQLVATGSRHRYTMLDTIKHHADGLLDDLGERLAAEEAHAHHYLAVAESVFATGSSQPETLQQLDPELDNLRAAYDRAQARGDHDVALRLASSLYPYWYVRGLFREGRDRVAAALAAETPNGQLHARACRVLASMHYLLDDDADADTVAQRGIEAGTLHDAPGEVLACHTVRGVVALRRGEFEQAREQIQASREIARVMGRDHDVIIAETNLGEIALRSGDPEAAHRHFEAARDWHVRNGTEASFSLIGLGTAARRLGRLDEADEHLAGAVAHALANGRPQNAILAEVGRAAIWADRGDFEAAARLLGSVRVASERLDSEVLGNDAAEYHIVEAAVRDAVGADQMDDWIQQGRADAEAAWREGNPGNAGAATR